MAVKHVGDEDFDSVVLGSDKPVLVDFWAEWCGPCKQVGPIIDALANEKAGSIDVVKIDISENPMSPSKFGVTSIPTLMLFKDGKLLDLRKGAASKEKIAEWVEGVLRG